MNDNEMFKMIMRHEYIARCTANFSVNALLCDMFAILSFITCVAIVHMGLYTSDIGWGRWLNIVHETVCRQWFGVA